jgi:hypothetical protein
MEKSFTELQEYSDTQFRTIVELRKQLEAAKEEVKSLKKMLESNVPFTTPISFGNVPQIAPIGISNEQLICETQIVLLKERAISRELTLEEAKKFQIYTTILTEIHKNNEDAPDLSVQKLSDDELLKLVVDNDSTSGSAT